MSTWLELPLYVPLVGSVAIALLATVTLLPGRELAPGRDKGRRGPRS